MKSRLPKLLHPLGGRPLLAHVIEAARQASEARPLVVYSPATSQICDVFADEADFALQDEPRGTGDAVRAALTALPGETTEVLVLNGDVPLVDPALLVELVELRRSAEAVIALLTVDSYQPEGLGRIVRDDSGHVIRIANEKDATEEELAINEINAGFYAFDARWLRRRIPDLRPSPATGELYLTDLVDYARADHRPAVTLEVEDDGTLQGINDRVQLAAAELDLRFRINQGHMLAGVTIHDPGATYVDASVEIAPDVTLEPNVILRGSTRIGRGTIIRSGSQIFDSVIGERCMVWASVLESSEVEDEVQIGPFAHLRPGASIGRGAKLGNFAEVKKSRIGAGTQQHHFSYIGDADVGEGVNIGAGTITANYDGRNKHRTVIGDRAFIGSDTMLIAPVTIGEGAGTGAGSVVNRDVPPDKMAVGVPARIRDRRRPTADDENAS